MQADAVQPGFAADALPRDGDGADRPGRRAALIAAMVAALDSSGSNARRRSATIRRIITRNASETVRPMASRMAEAPSMVAWSTRAGTTVCMVFPFEQTAWAISWPKYGASGKTFIACAVQSTTGRNGPVRMLSQ